MIGGQSWIVDYEILSNQTLVVVFKALGADIRPTEMTHYVEHYWGVTPTEAEKVDYREVDATGNTVWAGSYKINMVLPHRAEGEMQRNPPQVIGWAPLEHAAKERRIIVRFHQVDAQCFHCREYKTMCKAWSENQCRREMQNANRRPKSWAAYAAIL